MRRTFVLPAALAVLLCAGCGATAEAGASGDGAGSGGTAPSAPSAPAVDHADTVRSAAAATRATSARTSQTMDLTTATAAFTITVVGDFDMAGDKGSLAVDLPGGAISHADEVFADGVVHVRGAGGVPAGSWASLARDKAESHYILRAPLNDPEHVLEQIPALARVTRGEEEDLDGVRAVHYRGTLPYEALTSRIAADKRAPLDTLRTQLGGELPVTTDVWVDGQGRVVRTHSTLDVGGVKSVTTVAFTDLGKPVRVEVPAARDTVPASSFSGVLTG
ncbi:hypothetical protein OG898_30335 [Streptomyces sp. NBC_00193]|uniref:hypothetical protein n=1 Tax=Streptomyces sp. NBC_00193 TaxID=2975675 RepID=UPI0022578702|nr:hypothetical protein [Streptomyces sp. NBC_00193]MCX5300712.1 hypothetical protein [Streptomyces sp. NBC_00193]